MIIFYVVINCNICRFHEDTITYPDVESIKDFASMYGKTDLNQQSEASIQASHLLLDHVRLVTAK